MFDKQKLRDKRLLEHQTPVNVDNTEVGVEMGGDRVILVVEQVSAENGTQRAAYYRIRRYD